VATDADRVGRLPTLTELAVGLIRAAQHWHPLRGFVVHRTRAIATRTATRAKAGRNPSASNRTRRHRGRRPMPEPLGRHGRRASAVDSGPNPLSEAEDRAASSPLLVGCTDLEDGHHGRDGTVGITAPSASVSLRRLKVRSRHRLNVRWVPGSFLYRIARPGWFAVAMIRWDRRRKLDRAQSCSGIRESIGRHGWARSRRRAWALRSRAGRTSRRASLFEGRLMVLRS